MASRRESSIGSRLVDVPRPNQGTTRTFAEAAVSTGTDELHELMISCRRRYPPWLENQV